MRKLPFLLVSALIFGAGFSQTPHSPKTPLDAADHQALVRLQKDMDSALTHLEDCLPIFAGHRELAIRALYKALVNVDKALNGKDSPKRKEPQAHDLQGPKVGVKYTEKQVMESQSQLQQGLQALQQSQKDLDAAVGHHTDVVGNMVRVHLKTAVKETDKALGTQPSQA